MRTDVIRIYKEVHTWTAILAGLALFVAFYAGAITMFKEPLARWATPPGTRVHEVPLERTPELMARTIEARPEVAQQFTLVVDGHEATPARLVWFQRGQVGAAVRGEVPQVWSASIDGSGALQLRPEQPSQLAELVDVLHRTAGIPGDMDIGMGFMGIVSALYAVALVSGVIVLLPTLIKDFFAVRLGKNLKRMWLDAHNVVGIVSLPFHLIMALSGVVFGMHDLFYDAQNELIYREELPQYFRAHSPFVPPPARSEPAAMMPPRQLLDLVHARAPGFAPTSMTYQHAGDTAASVLVRGTEPSYLLRTQGYLLMSAVDGSVLNSYYFPSERNSWTALASSFFSLHFGSFGGLSVRWSYFFLGLAGAFLFYSGNLLWIESRRRTARRDQPAPEQRRSTRLMAAGTVGVCLGCICGISGTIAAAKWLQGRVDNVAVWHMGLYYAVFLGSVGWSFLRGGAQAAVHLLWLASVFTLAIPLTTLLAWVFPSLGLWAHTSAAALSVDLSAAIGCLCFSWMALATARRVRHGPADSVWSAHTVTGPGRA